MTQEQHIQVFVSKQSDQMKQNYRVWLTSSVKCIRFLLRQGLAFHRHDECIDSLNRGNFLETLKLLANNNEDVDKVVMQNAPENHQMIAPPAQKDIANAFAIDEARDISIKEQMVVFIRYVDSSGHIVERILGIIHVPDITFMSLKVAIEDLLTRHGLSISRIQRQGYDGASNMRALVGVARDNYVVGDFFVTVSQLCNITYFVDVTSDPALSALNGIDELAQKMVETGRHLDYRMVYLLLKLSLILPVATASVERAFSTMKLIKTPLRNRMSDDLLNDCLVSYVEKAIFDQVSNEAVLHRFQNMREHRGVLSRNSS
ncbi:uncharacterized protein LOC115995930 [Ipomoea triloba]|uniref:uncharacterized protein LOC115995930 n=1 Tax=Ipomoea triloba TaxID=35885 RepID=UPI00125E7A88|nr:uncharacterized protein LOC115995930 [Ipomoea triloba]